MVTSIALACKGSSGDKLFTRSINRKPPVSESLKATNENRAQVGDSEGLDLEKECVLSLSEDVGLSFKGMESVGQQSLLNLVMRRNLTVDEE